MEASDERTSVSEEAASVDDNPSRTSSSLDEQSESSGESDNDADADIDRMLSELEGFQAELIQSDDQPAAEPEEESNEPLDEISFSMNAIEDSGDIDLDALLEDLCSMERDLMSATENEMSTSGQTDARSPSPSKLSPRRLSSPVKVTADVKWKLGALEEELENQNELTLEEQQAKFKEEKIRIAMEKLREARVKKLVIKVFNDEDPTSKTILVDQTWTAWDVCKKMLIKYDREASTNWLLVERQPENQLDRVLEDHECIVDIVSQWPRQTSNQLLFTLRRDKYALFKSPQNYLLSGDTAEGSTRLAEQSKDTLISEFFKSDAMRLPKLDGVLHLKEGKKSWKKHYFLLRASGVYYTPKGKVKNHRNLTCLVSFENTFVYTANEFKKTQKAPTEHCFVIKTSIAKDLDSRQVKCLCAPDAQTMQRWVTCIRVGKFGYKMLENKNLAYEEVEDLTVGDVKRTRTMSSSSSSSSNSEFGSHGANQKDIAERVRNRSDASEHQTYKKSHGPKPQQEKGAKAIGKLFQDAWKKGSTEETVPSPGTPPTPFSPPRSSQTPTSGPKSFFVENEKLRSIDNIKEEANNVAQKINNQPLVLDPAPPPRKSFSNQGNQGPPTQDSNSSPPLPTTSPKHASPSSNIPPPPVPPPPPPPSFAQETSEQAHSLDDKVSPSNANHVSPVLPKLPLRPISYNGFANNTKDATPPPPPPPPPIQPDSQNSLDDFPLPPPPVSPPLVSPKPKPLNTPKFNSPDLPASQNVSNGLANGGAPPPPPPPPPLPSHAS